MDSDLVSVVEIAKLFGITTAAVGSRSRHPDFPQIGGFKSNGKCRVKAYSLKLVTAFFDKHPVKNMLRKPRLGPLKGYSFNHMARQFISSRLIQGAAHD